VPPSAVPEKEFRVKELKKIYFDLLTLGKMALKSSQTLVKIFTKIGTHLTSQMT
jgi:uncharacterized protein (UPF0128 family)